MRSILRWAGLVLILASMGGCKITAVTPGTTDTIVLKPHETQVFTAEGINFIWGVFPLFHAVGFGWVVSDEWNGYYKCGSDAHANGKVCSSFSYTPTEDNAGVKTIEVYLGIWHEPLNSPGAYFANATDSRIWTVEVWGITRTPASKSLTMQQGNKQSLSVTPCPAEGTYAYQWFLDGNLISGMTGASFDFSPGSGDVGTHQIDVTATGWEDGSTFTQTWSIVVSS